MDHSIISKMESWEKNSFTRGYSELQEMNENGFSGSIEMGESWLFMVKGNIIGMEGRGIDDFERGEGTVYVSPHPALPLLFSMQSKTKEEGMQYYTENKPIGEMDTTLKEAKFTGYVELSENVLSGDYYLVYHKGRVMEVAFIGNTNRLLVDEEARKEMESEIGIYQVNPASIDSIQIPGIKNTDVSFPDSAENVEVQSEEEQLAEDRGAMEEEIVLENITEEVEGEVVGNEIKFNQEMEWRTSRIVPSIDPTKDSLAIEILKNETELEDPEVQKPIVEKINEIVEERVIPKREEKTQVQVGKESQSDENEIIQNIVDPEFAKERSNIFIRYKNDDGPTLSMSLRGRKAVGSVAVERNLRYEIHSRFDTDTTLVKCKGGTESVKEYILKTPEYRFSKWAYLKLPYEIKGTKNIKLFKSLYRAIPDMDRIQLRESVETISKEGESRRHRFDIIVLNEEGDPLIVANVNDDLDPTGGEMVTELVESASRLAEGKDTLVAAFLVSSSYHSKEAREVAVQKMKGKKRSWKGDPRIKVSRKKSFYLGLVECREGEEVHLLFPEL